MNDYISREALLDIIDGYPTDTLSYASARKCIREMPAADVVEVVRCKECKNWDTTWQNDWAKNYHYCPLIDGTRNGDFYCADAERRTDETD